MESAQSHSHKSAISGTDYSEHSRHIIKMAQSFGIQQKSDSQTCILLGPSDKLAIKLKLMINLLEGMHVSDLRLHIQDVDTSEILNTELNSKRLTVSLLLSFPSSATAVLKQKLAFWCPIKSENCINSSEGRIFSTIWQLYLGPSSSSHRQVNSPKLS